MMFLQFVIAFIQIGASLAEDKATAIARLENLLHQLTEKTAQRDVAISSSVLNSNFPYVKTQSMRSHLMTLGWQKKDFDKENEERKQQRKEHEKRIVIPAEKSKEKVYSWFEKKINSTFFQKVEGLCHGIETFVYIPEHRKTMHDGLRLFVKSRYNPKLVKPILGMKVVVNVRLFNKVEDVVVTHELKSNNTEDRLLLATFYSDDKKAKLLIAVDYIKDGLHTLGNKRAIIDSAATNAALDIHFPWLMLEDNGLKARV